MNERKLIRSGSWGSISQSRHTGKMRLTYEGWEEYERLKRKTKDSRKAFMAMPFVDNELDSIYKDIYCPAVDDTGFKLFRIDENPEAGSIINRMKVAIRSSRFLVAEITGNNQNVYWEAGFAEGLGIPVIYMCRKKDFDDKDRKPKFDIGSDHTVVWDGKSPDKTKRELKACIRATLPNETKSVEDEAA